MEERQSFVDFEDDSGEFYESLTSVADVLAFWDQAAYIDSFAEIDGQLIREYISQRGPMKVIMGPHFIIVFDNEPDETLVIYYIQRTSFLRPR